MNVKKLKFVILVFIFVKIPLMYSIITNFAKANFPKFNPSVKHKNTTMILRYVQLK
jgi:hypothetical protein